MATATATRTAREYLRVSKGKGKTARSIDDQHRENIAAGQDHGPWTWGAAYTDTGSASKFRTKARGDFDQLTADLASGAFGEGGAVLVLWEISRLSREMSVGTKIVDLCEAAGYLIHVTSDERTYNPQNYNDRHTLNAGINDAERETGRLSKRSRKGVNGVLENGGVHGKLPFGYTRDYEFSDGRPRPVRQYPDPDEGPLVVELFERVAGWNGRKRESIRAVEQDWKARGIRSRGAGVVLSRQYLAQVLRRKAYVGIRVHKGTERPGNWTPLIDPELFDAVQRILADPSRRSTTTTAVKHVLTGVLRCGTCGGKVSLRPGGRAYDGRLVYRCYDRDCFTVDKEQTDAALIGDAKHPGVILAYLSAPHRYAALTHRPDSGPDEAGLRAELATKRGQLKAFEDEDPETPAEARLIGRKIQKLEDEAAALEAKLSALTAPDPMDRLRPKPGTDVVTWWAALDVQHQRAVAAVLFAPDGPFGQPRIKRVADCASDAVQDRIVWVGADGTEIRD